MKREEIMRMCGKMNIKNFKPSIFNFVFYEDNVLYVANDFYNTYIKCSDKNGEKVINCLEGNYDVENEVFEFLREKELLVPIDRNEANLLEYERNKLIFANNELYITVIPTLSCNFKCVYCYEKGNLPIITYDKLENLKLYISKNAKYYRSVRINWFGGEPLLGLDIIMRFMADIKAICKKTGVPVVGQMTTNGFWLTADVFERLYQNKILYYQVSVDGLSEIQNRYRPTKNGDDSYEKVIKNLLDIKALDKRYFQIAIRANISMKTYKNIRDFVDFLAFHFRNDERFVFYVCKISDWGGNRVPLISDELMTNEKFALVENEVLNYALDKGLNVYVRGSEKVGSGICNYLKESAFVFNYDGSVYKCTLGIEDIKNSVGIIDKRGKLILNDNYYKWIPRLNYDMNECMQCNQLALCMCTICNHHAISEKKCIRKAVMLDKSRYIGKTDWDVF